MSLGGSSRINSGLLDGNPAGVLEGSFACGILVVSAHGRIVASSPEAAAILQAKATRLQSAPVDSLPAPLPTLIRDAAKSGQAAANLELSLKTARGDSVTTLCASILPVKTLARSQVVVVLYNLTSSPVFEQSMRRLDRLASLGTLSASMAHEIKNGMVAIKTFIDLLLQKGQDTELTDVVNRELQRINAIVTQMLRFAVPKETTFTTVRVHELLDHSLRLLHHQITGKLISLQRRYEAPMDTVRGSDVQLQQAFMNLILNALEAMDSKGVLTIATEIVENESGSRLMRIHVQDTGVGIAQENLGRLFEPFFTTKKDGTGLGLSICQRIIQEHHGVIEAQSKVNQGSRFSLSLPMLSA
jgi:signal transduction histidine kinase